MEIKEIELCGRTLLEKLKMDADFITKNFISILDEKQISKIEMLGLEVFDEMKERAGEASQMLFFLCMISLISAFPIPNSDGSHKSGKVLQ